MAKYIILHDELRLDVIPANAKKFNINGLSIPMDQISNYIKTHFQNKSCYLYIIERDEVPQQGSEIRLTPNDSYALFNDKNNLNFISLNKMSSSSSNLAITLWQKHPVIQTAAAVGAFAVVAGTFALTGYTARN
jgi:hypothetical protein